MDKLVTLEGRNERGIFTYVIDAERGYLEKTAAAYHPTIGAYINAAKPIKGKTQILLTALGAGEYWGNNVNGDWFSENSLAHEGHDYGYKTFEHYAKVYKHHCFTKGTKVKTSEGFSPIEDVSEGTEVMCHDGEFHSVTTTFRNYYSGPLRHLKVQGVGRSISCTPEHQFLVVRREQLICPNHRRSGKNFCTFFRTGEERCQNCDRSRVTPATEWVGAKDIQVGDYITQAITAPPEGTDPHSGAWGTVLGFFLSEGCYSKRGGTRRGLQFTFGKDELGLIAKLKISTEALGYTLTGPYFHKKNNTALVLISSKDLADKVYAWCGEYSDRKFISPDLVPLLGAEGMRSLVGAYIDGDGHVYSSGRNAGLVRIRSVNFAMLETIRDHCLSMGLYCSFNIDSPKSRENAFGTTSSPSAVLSFRQSVAARLSEYSDKCRKAGELTAAKKGATAILGEGRWLHRVAGVAETENSTTVYNLEVEGAHSYQVFGLDTHNCNKPHQGDQVYGDVALSVYNTLFHRVELVIHLDNAAAPDLVDRVNNGDYFDFSMGCKVPYDRCSICNNKAPTRAQYCDHLRYYMGRVPPGLDRVAFAINDFPRFFDISVVLIGADRIAKMHRKIASAVHNHRGISSALLAEKAAASKIAVIEKETPASAPPGSMDSLRTLLDSIPEVKAREASLPTEVLNRLGAAGLPAASSSMAALGILPKPQEFQRIVLISLGQRAAADALDQRGLCFDPMDGQESPEAESRLGLSTSNFSPDIMQLLLPFLGERSYAAPHLGRRLVVMIKRASAEPLPTFLKLSNDSERKPIGILPMLALAAGMYAVFARKAPPEAVKGIDKLVAAHPGIAAALGLGLYATFNKLVAPAVKGNFVPGETYTNPDAVDVFKRIEEQKSKPYTKVASIGAAAKRLFIGIPAAYMASGVLQKHRELNPSDGESRMKSFIRRNPDVVSGALVADAMLALHGGGTHGLISRFAKGAAAAAEIVGEEAMPKTASAQEFLVNAALPALAMGKVNLPGRIVGGLFDQAALEVSKKVLEKKQGRPKHQGD